MKRFVAIILIFTVISALAACGKPAEEPTTQTTVPEPKTTTAVQVTETQPQPGKPFFQLSSLPDIGAHKNNAVVDRWYKTYQEQLIPRDDYGTLVPFIGEIQNYEYEVKYEGEGDGPDNSFAYGLMTTEGKIVVDAVYRWITTVTAPNGKTFYRAESFSQTNVPGAQADSNSVKYNGRSFVFDTNGSSFLEIPQDYSYYFTRDKVVLTPSNYFETEPLGTFDSIYVYNMSLELVNTLSVSAMVGKYQKDYEYYPYVDGGYLSFDRNSFRLYFDLEGNPAEFDNHPVSYAEYFGDYTLLDFEDGGQRLVDASGKDCTPAGNSGMSVTWVTSDAEGSPKLLLVNTEDGFQVYDTSLRPIGSPHYGKLHFYQFFGKLCYRFDNSSEDPLLYYELETDKHLDWSKYTKLDMSEYAPDYAGSYMPPKIYKDRLFLYEYTRKENEEDAFGTRYHKLIDLQNGKTYYKSDNYVDVTCYGKWLLILGADNKDMIMDSQTGRIELQQDNIDIFEVNGTSYALWMNNGYSFVQNLDTQETLLRMFVASAG